MSSGINLMRNRVILVTVLAVASCFPATALAHGVSTRVSLQPNIVVVASYDNGAPMAGAQVLVFSPHNPRTPWLATVADETGRVVIAPDPSIEGTWALQVRQAGHGAMVHVNIVDKALQVSAESRMGTWQKLIIFISIAWGCIGTALYFKRSKALNAHS